MARLRPLARLSFWLERWGGIVPLLLAEFIVWLGFGALLPVLPLYFTQQGVDLALLGLVIAAWPAARLVGEPIFGWLADRTARIPLMVIGLIATGVFSILPLVFTGPLAFVLLRAGSGLATAVYDPAARGYLTDATRPSGAARRSGCTAPSRWAGCSSGRRSARSGPGSSAGSRSCSCSVGWRPGWRRSRSGSAVARAGRAPTRRRRATPPSSRPRRHRPRAAPPTPSRRIEPRSDGGSRRPALLNRGLIAALVINAGGYFAGGTYEVIWSLFLQHLGAGLDLIGLTFAMFGLPVLLLSPFVGRLVDRRGSLAFIVAGSILPAIIGIAYTQIANPLVAVR